MTTVELVNTYTMSHNCFFFMVRTFKIESLSNFQLYNTVPLTIITMLYIRAAEFIHLLTASVYPLTNIFPFPSSPIP